MDTYLLKHLLSLPRYMLVCDVPIFLALYTLTSRKAVGIIGATVMPHGMYLGSHLSTLDRVSSKNTSSNFTLPQPSQTNSTTGLKWLKKALKDLISVRRVRQGREEDQLDTWTPYGERKNNPLSFVKAHYKHGLWDLVLSLLGFAVTINSA